MSDQTFTNGSRGCWGQFRPIHCTKCGVHPASRHSIIVQVAPLVHCLFNIIAQCSVKQVPYCHGVGGDYSTSRVSEFAALF